MRGIYNSVTDLRRQVFTAIASMAYDDNTDYSKRMEEIPYEILLVQKQNIVIVFF